MGGYCTCHDRNQQYRSFLHGMSNLLNLLNLTNRIIDTYYPLHKLTKKEFKQTLKPWITTGILNSIQRKDELFRRYMACKDNVIKSNTHNEYKALKNRITSLIHFSKKKLLY